MQKLILFFIKAFQFLTHGIWSITEHELSRTRRFGYRFIRIIILAVRGFIDERLNVKASALTYSILFAIVPMIALLVGIGRGFGVEKLIEQSLQDSFFAQANLIPYVMAAVGRYLESTQAGIFVGIGLAILIVSVMNFFIQVELAFNSIWQVKKSRSIVRQFTLYFSAMLIAPILIVLSSGFTIYINNILATSSIFSYFSPFIQFILKFSPYVVNGIIFSLLYIVIPNTKVKIGNGILAGVLAGSAFQFFQMLYINGQVYLSRFNVVYGSFAAIPLLLLWLQISCLIVLLGAEISYAAQNTSNFDYEGDTQRISTRYRNFITLFLTYVIVKRFENNIAPYSSDDISREYKLPIRLVNTRLSKLVDAGILIEVFNEENKQKAYQPAIDIHQLSLELYYNKVESTGAELFLANKHEVLDAFWEKTLSLKHNCNKDYRSILIKDILNADTEAFEHRLEESFDA